MRWERVGPLGMLGEGVGKVLELGEHRIALFRVEDRIYAIGDVCSHAEASLAEGEVFDVEVECPRHGSTFDLRTGRPLTLPATRPVPVYPTKVEEGVIFVEVPD